MLRHISKFLNYIHEKGIPLPLFRDKNEGSVSLTLLVVAFTVALKAVMSEKSTDSMMYALALFGMCGSMYWGKKWQIRKIGAIDISGGAADEQDEETKTKEN